MPPPGGSVIGSAVSQGLLNAMLRLPAQGMANRAAFYVLNECRRWLVRAAGDPLVRYRLENAEILLPLSHMLPIHRRMFPDYSSNVGRIARHVLAKYPELTFIDMGANVGDTVAVLRSQAHFPVLCIEGNEQFFAILQMNAARLWREVDIERALVAPVAGEIRGRLVAREGTAYFEQDESSGEAFTGKTLSDVLRLHRRFARSKMIKVDTDGWDSRILRGELELLREVRPVVFFEYAPYFFALCQDDGFQVFESLRAIGFKRLLVYENTGDYLLEADIENTALLEDLHALYSRKGAERYADMCAFHEEDTDLCETIRRAELEFFCRTN